VNYRARAGITQSLVVADEWLADDQEGNDEKNYGHADYGRREDDYAVTRSTHRPRCGVGAGTLARERAELGSAGRRIMLRVGHGLTVPTVTWP